MLAAYFRVRHSRESQGEYNCAVIKVDWLAACIALRAPVVGAVFVIFLQRWLTMQPMGSKGQYLKKCT
jgi:hypothetical protein